MLIGDKNVKHIHLFYIYPRCDYVIDAENGRQHLENSSVISTVSYRCFISYSDLFLFMRRCSVPLSILMACIITVTSMWHHCKTLWSRHILQPKCHHSVMSHYDWNMNILIFFNLQKFFRTCYLLSNYVLGNLKKCDVSVISQHVTYVLPHNMTKKSPYCKVAVWQTYELKELLKTFMYTERNI